MNNDNEKGYLVWIVPIVAAVLVLFYFVLHGGREPLGFLDAFSR